MKSIYYALRPSTGEFIAIMHGSVTFYVPTVVNQAHADKLNANQGHTPAQVKAAFICCFNNMWSRFDALASNIEHFAKVG